MFDNKSKSNEADWGFAGFDFAKLIESCQISGVDMTSLIDMEKKNMRRSSRSTVRHMTVGEP